MIRECLRIIMTNSCWQLSEMSMKCMHIFYMSIQITLMWQVLKTREIWLNKITYWITDNGSFSCSSQCSWIWSSSWNWHHLNSFVWFALLKIQRGKCYQHNTSHIRLENEYLRLERWVSSWELFNPHHPPGS